MHQAIEEVSAHPARGALARRRAAWRRNSRLKNSGELRVLMEPAAPAAAEEAKAAVADVDWKQRAEAAEALVAKLQADNASLKRENDALLGKVDQLSRVMNEELDSARKRMEAMAKAAPPLPRARAEKDGDAALCARFGLPAGDFAVATYACRDRDSKVRGGRCTVTTVAQS